MHLSIAIVGLFVVVGAARADETLRFGGKAAGRLPASMVVRRDLKLDGTMTIVGQQQPVHLFRSSEAEERERDDGKLDLRLTRLVDEKGDAGRELAGRSFVVVGDEPKRDRTLARGPRNLAEAVSTHAKAHRRDARLAKWLASHTFVRDQPLEVPREELRALTATKEAELTDGKMSLTWTGTQGSTALFRLEVEVALRGPGKNQQPVDVHLKLAGTISADSATAAIIETDLKGTFALQGIIPMTADVTVHELRR